MKYRTQYDPHERFITDNGKAEYTTYTEGEDGKPVKSGISNLYEEIQSHRDSVELSTLLQRYANGDVTALSKTDGVYEDIVDMPGTYAELFNRVKEAEDSFNNFPPDLKKIFNDSPIEFWQSVGTPDFNKKLTKYDNSKKISKSKKTTNGSNNGDPGINNDPPNGNANVINDPANGNGGVNNE